MTSTFTSISRKELAFMAEETGPELVAVMSPDEVLKGFDREKQLHLIKSSFKELVEGAELAKLLAELPPDSRKTSNQATYLAALAQVPDVEPEQYDRLLVVKEVHR